MALFLTLDPRGESLLREITTLLLLLTSNLHLKGVVVVKLKLVLPHLRVLVFENAVLFLQRILLLV